MSLGNKPPPGVRLARGALARAAEGAPPPPAVRRRPRQSRAQASAQALQDAFVRVLIERGYARTTIRELVGVAGVGVGTFYDYFGNKHALAAFWIHQRVQALEAAVREAAAAAAGRSLADVVDAVLAVQLGTVLQAAPEWAALFLLERQISSIDAFRSHYGNWVQMWQSALLGAADPPQNAAGAARLLHAISYGWISQSLLAHGPGVDAQALRAGLVQALHAVLGTLERENPIENRL